jgi:hypothetical protein
LNTKAEILGLVNPEFRIYSQVMTDKTTQSDNVHPLDFRIARGNALVEQVGDEVAIIDLATHRVSTLNVTGARIWEALAEPNTIEHCVAAIVERTSAPREVIERDTQLFVTRLLDRGLLVPG